MAAIPHLAEAAANPLVYRNINLHPLKIHLLALLRMYNDPMERCLASSNLEVHYVHDIQEYATSTEFV